MKNLALHWTILIGMALGVAFGLVAVNTGLEKFTVDWIKPFGILESELYHDGDRFELYIAEILGNNYNRSNSPILLNKDSQQIKDSFVIRETKCEMKEYFETI